jgi:predicted dehydrogenase
MSLPILRVAIIGTGRIAATYDDEVSDRRPPAYYTGPNRHSGAYTILPTNHAESIQTTPGYALIAAANRTPQKLQDFGDRFGVQALYQDFRLLLANEQFACRWWIAPSQFPIASASLPAQERTSHVTSSKARCCPAPGLYQR